MIQNVVSERSIVGYKYKSELDTLCNEYNESILENSVMQLDRSGLVPKHLDHTGNFE